MKKCLVKSGAKIENMKLNEKSESSNVLIFKDTKTCWDKTWKGMGGF
jgi:hypothetical protein